MKGPSATNFSKGFSVIEILIAFSILVLSISAIVIVIFGNQSLMLDTKINLDALQKAQTLIDKAKIDADFDFNLVNPTSTDETDGEIFYEKKLKVEQTDLYIKKLESSINWRVKDRVGNLKLTTLLVDKNGEQNENTCSSLVNGDWRNLKHWEYDLGQLGVNGGAGKDFGITDIKVHNKKLFVAIDQTPTGYHGSHFFIFDLTDPTKPTYLGETDNNTPGLNAVTVSGNYAYLANTSINGQLQIVDIKNPASPKVISTFKLTNVTGSGGQAVGKNIFYSSKKIYLGLTKTSSGPELNIIDVANPYSPTLLGGYSVGKDVNGIYAKDDYVFVASPSNEDLTVIDASEPLNPIWIGGFSPVSLPDSNGSGSNHGKSVYVVGNNIYLGRTYGNKEFYYLDLSDTNLITAKKDLDVGGGNKTSVYGLIAKDYLVFIMTKAQFQIWDISSTDNPKPFTQDETSNSFLSLNSLGGSGTSMDCEGNYFYLALSGSSTTHKDVISIITPAK